ncbi:MerR family transcriptional regulator [uncultured Desulfobacter sp.]|uniref:MerR family transcriptional regulator n=1 Tax=uncultured Desulfobacter sp. TaxID=240139 RepID=UPI002AABB806|nr:MerR family transcriptional regulator [uncultured Desulfobacter sp.]
MTRSKLLTIQDLIDELAMGKATLKFVLHRFSPWLAPNTQMINQETYYTEQAVASLLKIRKFLDSGLLPEQIEELLAQQAQWLKDTAPVQHHTANPGTPTQDTQLDAQSASMFKDMLEIFMEKQERIAMAQEALSRVEERKADAMEKRAAAEEKKAAAMTTIALALQQMNERHGLAAPNAMEIAGKAVEILAVEETCDLDESLLDTDFNSDQETLDSEHLFQNQSHGSLGDIKEQDMDDLSLLVNDNALTRQELDDLSALIDSVSSPAQDLDDLASLLDDPEPVPAQTDGPADHADNMDDLSKLIGSDPESLDYESLDNVDHAAKPEDDLDDLSLLVGTDTQEDIDDLSKLVNLGDHEDIDDLSKLIDQPRDHDAADLDDLYALIEQPIKSEPTMDDLSLLVGDGRGDDEQIDEQVELDDLSSLVSDTANSSPSPSKPEVAPVEDHGMDNLSALLTDTQDSADHKIAAHVEADTDIKEKFDEKGDGEPASIKPDISPDQDMGQYKAAVMQIIIDLKGRGLTAQQTTDRLNRDGVATLSGKPAWGLKAIEKIYGFIESAK